MAVRRKTGANEGGWLCLLLLVGKRDGGLPGWARRGAGRGAGCCGVLFALSIEKGAAGTTWVSGRRMLSWLTSRAGALIRLLIWGEYIQQGGQVWDVQMLLGVQS